MTLIAAGRLSCLLARLEVVTERIVLGAASPKGKRAASDRDHMQCDSTSAKARRHCSAAINLF